MRASVKTVDERNPLGYEKIGKLMLSFAIPAIVGMVVNAVYNLVDQVLIGWSDIGMLGIGATTVSFPFTTIMNALGLVISVGCAANFNLSLGAGNKDRAARFAGNAISLGVIVGILFSIVALIFLRPLLTLFGATEDIMPYAVEYTRIIIFGIPFAILSSIFSLLIRADGSPRFSMVCMLAGALFYLIFDPIALFVFDLGIQGIAIATSCSMLLSAIMGALYFVKSFRSAKLVRDSFRIRWAEVKSICSLGTAAFINQIAMTAMQIVLNNALKKYGALSVFGSNAVISCVGSINKVNMIFHSILIGIGQGCQPINGFNYGAQQYDRVKRTYKLAFITASCLAACMFIVYQIFPKQILLSFGNNPDTFFEFGARYMRIYMFMTFLSGVQPITANFFTSIGKSKKGSFIALTRQIIFLIPLLLILPRFFGIDGVLYAGPIADFAAATVGILLVVNEMKKMTAMQNEVDGNPVLPV